MAVTKVTSVINLPGPMHSFLLQRKQVQRERIALHQIRIHFDYLETAMALLIVGKQSTVDIFRKGLLKSKMCMRDQNWTWYQ